MPDLGPSDSERRPSMAVDVLVGDTTVLRLEPGAGRVAVGLVMGRPDHVVDISPQPSAALARIDDAAARLGVPVQAARSRALAALRQALERAGGAAPDPSWDLVTAFGAASHPLLGQAYARGAAPIGEVPRWAVPVLVRTEVREAAEVAFGPRVTRPVVTALAQALAPPSASASAEGSARPAGIGALGLAMLVAPALDPDRLATLLRELAPVAPLIELDAEDLRVGALVAVALGPAGAARLAHDAATLPDGAELLHALLLMWEDAASLLPHRLPARLPQLHDLCRAQLRTDRGPPPGEDRPHASRRRAPARAPSPSTRAAAAPAPRPRRPRAAPTERTGHARPVADPSRPRLGEVPLAPPPLPPAPDAPTGEEPFGPAPLTDATPLPLAPQLAPADGLEVGEVRLVLPRTCGDLRRWGRTLRSCVGDYGPAVVAGRSHIVGIFHGAVMVGCLEIDPAGHLRQILGPANRPLAPDVRTGVIDRLTRLGVLRPA